MSMHFSGNQFEPAYKPKILRNWEVPKFYQNVKPKVRKGKTEIVSNDRGHLLPGVPKSRKNPWGDFKGTWHLPKKIDRKTANELSGLGNPLSCEEKRKLREKRKGEAEPEVVAEKIPETETEQQEVAEKDSYPYIPGDLTDEQYRSETHHTLAENRFNPEKPHSNGYPRNREDFSRSLPEIAPKNDVEEEYKLHKRMSETNYHQPIKPKKKTSKPIIEAIKNFQLAKKLHRENLEHDPLPDTITHTKYRQLQMQRPHHEPGLALENENYATGIGWKGYPGYGPTRCTKLKVYRPKTCGHVDKPPKNDGRPSSVTSFDRKWRFIRRRKVTPIELAICWDLTPDDPNDEPKRTPHIDGSNGSLAPAVFSLVHTPKEEESRKNSLDSGPVFEKAPPRAPGEKDFVLDRPKTSQPSSKSSSNGSGKKRAKSAYNLNNKIDEEVEVKSCSRCSEDTKNEMHQSTPNLSGDKKARMCMACEMKNVSLKERRNKNEYKMAFKAGIPQKIKDKRQDYPEHWRLATVYQHSYKPIHTRKRPLLATVFK